MEGISICITAYDATDFIEETLNSIAAQDWFVKNDNWEVIVGIDHCIKTAYKIKDIMQSYDLDHFRFYMMDSNRGTYITTNTIMQLAKYDILFRFDSDDIMMKDAVSNVMSNFKDSDYATFNLKNFNNNENIILDRQNVATGQLVIRKSIFDKFGGFRPWICAADKEFVCRLKNITKYNHISIPILLRRRHGNNLTMKTGTDLKSDLRNKYHELTREDIYNEKEAIIECETNTFKEITVDSIIFEDYAQSFGNNIVVYTYSDDILPEIRNKCANIDYVCFTSNAQLKSSRWRVMLLPKSLAHMSPYMKEEYVKTHPNELLKGYDAAMFVSNVTDLIGNTGNFIKFNDVVATSWIAYTAYENENSLVAAVKKYSKNYNEVQEQYTRYSKRGLTNNASRICTDVLIYKLNDEQCSNVLAVWWTHIQKYKLSHDSFALTFLLSTHTFSKAMKIPFKSYKNYFTI